MPFLYLEGEEKKKKKAKARIWNRRNRRIGVSQ